jgi:hypothetical protein
LKSWIERIRAVFRAFWFGRAPGKRRRTQFRETATAPNQGSALQLAQSPDKITVVIRGIPRTVVFQCPCGCGDILTVNVDPESGIAWELRTDGKTVTLLPSVWRTTGCRSHFILFKSRVWWCDVGEDATWPPELALEFRTRWIQPNEYL